MSLVFDVDEIPEEGMSFDVSEKPEHFAISSEDGELNQDVKVTGTLKKTGKEVFFTGRILANISVNCSRCLEPVSNQINVDVFADYVPRESFPEIVSDTELSKSDIDVEFYTENKIDLHQPIYDQIALSIPLVSLCSETCKGLCSQCGENLNPGPCRCGHGDTTDPRLAILKTLKNKL